MYQLLRTPSLIYLPNSPSNSEPFPNGIGAGDARSQFFGELCDFGNYGY
jgi:hypothetical protein